MRFLCDFMVQKLGRMLILLGFDTKVVKKPERLVDIILDASLQDRIIITRNTRIKNYPSKFILLREQKPYEQIKKVFKELNLNVDYEKLFSRCSFCNIILEEIEKEKISDKIPPLTLQCVENFYICPSCNKIYWKASHFDMFKERIKKVINEI